MGLKQKKLKGRNVYNFYERWVGWGGWVGGWDISGVGSHMRKLIESLSGNSLLLFTVSNSL